LYSPGTHFKTFFTLRSFMIFLSLSRRMLRKHLDRDRFLPNLTYSVFMIRSHIISAVEMSSLNDLRINYRNTSKLPHSHCCFCT
jgi:hypothetical protein